MASVTGIALLMYALLVSTAVLEDNAVLVIGSIALQYPLVKLLIKKIHPYAADKKEAVPNTKMYLLAALMLAVILGALIPSSVVSSSPQEFVDLYNYHNPLWYVVSAFCLSFGTWGPQALLSKYGEKIIQPLLDTGFHVIIRPHPQSFTSEKELMDNLMKQFPESEQLKWNRDNDNFEVLRESDLMISDFSGVIFDFSLIYDKPIIYTAAQIDTGVYDAWQQ